MIDNRGNVKIIDFGYSKNFNEFEMSTAIGSPLYMAPEVF
jgi:serine/threonine protein kinase